MGYSTDPRTAERMAPKLQALADGRETTWRVKEGDPAKFAYQIREALYIAEKNPGRFPKLARARARFKIVLDGQLVHAKHKTLAEEGLHVMDEVLVETASRHREVAQAIGLGYTETLTGPQTAYEVVQHFIDRGPSNTPLLVTEANFTNQELFDLQKWAEGLQPAWEVIHYAGETHLIIRPSAGRRFTTAPMPVHQARAGDGPETEVPG